MLLEDGVIIFIFKITTDDAQDTLSQIRGDPKRTELRLRSICSFVVVVFCPRGRSIEGAYVKRFRRCLRREC